MLNHAYFINIILFLSNIMNILTKLLIYQIRNEEFIYIST
jgi:hypothetical protein